MKQISFVFVYIVVTIFTYGSSSAQSKKYQWATYDTVRSDMDTAADGTPAKYLEQYDSAKIERLADSCFFLWTRAVPVSSTHKVSLREHELMPDSLYSSYSYAAFKIEIDCKEKRYKTWQWMYYDDRDNPVSGLKLSIETPVAWYPVTPALRKLSRRICN